MNEQLSRMKAAYLSLRHARHVDLPVGRCSFSITFDDVEASAVENALPILEEFGVTGTWYVAGALVGRTMTLDDLQLLAARRQDVQCHTYSHYRLADGDAQGLRDDAARNRAFLAAHLPGRRVSHFSYPFGQVDARAKLLLGRDYATMRSVYSGVNRGRVDLTLLRANAIYARKMDRDREIPRIRGTARRGGWLIYYTHGVEDAPDRWGCRPDDLRRLIGDCLDAGLTAVTVGAMGDDLAAGEPAAVERYTGRKDPHGVRTD